MGAPQFAQQVDNSTTDKKVFTEAEVTANTANQYDEDEANTDASAGYETGEQNVSGSQEIAGSIDVNDSGDVDVTIEWTDGAGTVVTSRSPSELQGVTDEADFNFITRSTHFNLKISGTSNDASLTVNAH